MGSKEGQNRLDQRTEKNRSVFELSISLDTIFQELLEAIAQAMRYEVSHVALGELGAKLSMREAKKANLDSEQTWTIYARKLIEAIFQITLM